MSAVEDWLAAHEAEGVAMIVAFCRIPSLSADPAFAPDIARAAAFAADRRREAGFPLVELVETPGHPCVLAEWITDPSLPTILVYGHYDVQPPDPLDQWRSPPFEPEVRDDRLHARGVSDDKGPLSIAIQVIRAFYETAGDPRSMSGSSSRARRNRAARTSLPRSSACASGSPATSSSRPTVRCGAPTCRR